jgi:hypothetical protein
MKKVLSIVLSLAMVVCLMPSMAFAATTAAKADVSYSDTEGTACEGAVNVLTALGVVNGYTDGTYKPEQVVTRAEMAKLVVTALGVDKYATATTSQFYDMSAAEWAIPYVEYAANLNIVNGYGNGKFGPNDTVTYEQAVTMIVRALGYTDDCKEMNGSWPAIYIQKATALGIFEDVVNGGATGADRGDVAIMLYNALDLPEVYADGDGATQYKNGSTDFTGTDGKTFKGTSMLATLNKSGTSEYGILSASEADDALINVRSYVGAVGKIYKDKDDNVLSVGDLKTEFLTGTVNSDGDEFTSNGVTYTVNDDAFSTVTDSGSLSKGANSVPKFVNGVEDGTYTKGTNGALDNVNLNKSITIAAKLSGRTITNILTISEWSKKQGDQDLFEESDANTINNKQALFGYDFKTDDDGDVDYSTFILTGVDSLDDIEEDNVVYVYADKYDKIRKVEVGTEVVEGTLNGFSKGTKADGKSINGNSGVQAKFEIDDTTYSGTQASVSKDKVDSAFNWTLSDDSDDVDVGDDVVAYLDSTGKIFQIEQLEAGASSYALVLDYDITWETSKAGIEVADSTALNDNDSLVKVLTAGGDVLTLTLKGGADIEADYKDTSGSEVNTITTDAFSVGDIITYNLNSSSKVKKITIKANAKIETTGALQNLGNTSDITAKGYWNGKAINDSAVLFSVDSMTEREKTYSRKTKDVPAQYIDEDDVDVVKLSSILDTDDVDAYSYVTKNGKYTAMVLNGNAVSNDAQYGLVTNVTKVDNDSLTADYRVTMLVNGETQSYYVDDDATTYYGTNSTPIKNRFYAFKTNASGYISKFDGESTGAGIYIDDTKTTFLGAVAADSNGDISMKSNVVADSYTVDSNVVYYNWEEADEEFSIGDKSDLTNPGTGYVALFLDTDKDDDKDGVADVVIIVPASEAANIVPASANNDTVTEAAKKSEAESAVKAAKAKVDGKETQATSDKSITKTAIDYATETISNSAISVEAGTPAADATSGNYPYSVALKISSKTVLTVSDTATVTVTSPPATN